MVRQIIMEQNWDDEKHFFQEPGDNQRRIEEEKREKGNKFSELETAEISSIMDVLQSFRRKW